MDVNSPEFLDNPYRFYADKRADAPIFRVNQNTWTITSYELMAKLLAHPAMGRGGIGETLLPGADAQTLQETKQNNSVMRILDQWMLFKNPPEHPKIRVLVADAFKRNNVIELEKLVSDTMRGLIKQIKSNHADNSFELVGAIAYPLPLIAICKMLGIPSQDIEKFGTWTQELSGAVQSNWFTVPAKTLGKWNAAASELEQYFKALIPQRRQQPEQDLISSLLLAEGELSEYQILANCLFLLFSGMETTTSMISNAVTVLLSHPEQVELLRNDPSLLKNTIDECLRYDPPVQMVSRFPLEDIELNGYSIKAGDRIFMFLGAAGRDQNANVNPDRFDITRSQIKHLAFAKGSHHCLGASLVRIELAAVIEELLAAFSHLEIAQEPKRKDSWLMRGMHSVNIAYKV